MLGFFRPRILTIQDRKYETQYNSDPSEKEEMAQRAEKMTEEMKTFRSRVFSGYIYVTIFWLVVCSLVQFNP